MQFQLRRTTAAMYTISEVKTFITVLSFVLFILILLHIFWNTRRKYNLPPGPINLPVVGYAPFAIGKNLEKFFSDLSKKYGDVVYFRIGTKSVETLNSYDTIKECLILNSNTAIGRPDDFNNINYIFNDRGMIVEDGKVWQEQRRFIMSTFRNLGIGKDNLKCEIRQETMGLVEKITKYCGQPFDPESYMMGASANIICALSYGVRHNRGEQEFEDLLSTFAAIQNNLNPLHILSAFPYLRFIAPDFLSGLDKLKAVRNQILQFSERKIQEQETTGHKHIRNYSEMYLNKQRNEEAAGNKNTSFNRENLKSNMIALSSGGTNTSSSNMRWILKMLIKFPKIQKRIQEEIDDAIGSDKAPSYSDRHNMPYTQAFLLEIHRYSSIVPFALPHASLVDTKLSGYDIPAGVTIFPMLFMVHNDPKIWGDPDNFRPERFLDSNGKLLRPTSQYLIPFGMGRRSCPGENLAKTEIFIFTTNLLQHFNFSAPSKEDIGTEVTGNSIGRDLLPFKVTATKRS